MDGGGHHDDHRLRLFLIINNPTTQTRKYLIVKSMDETDMLDTLHISHEAAPKRE
jgi:hypothetical protein